MRASHPKSFFAQWPVRRYLVLLVAAAVLPALGVIINTALQRERDTIEAQRFRCVAAVGDLAEVFRTMELEAHRLLTTLVDLPQVRARQTTECNELFARILRQSPTFTALSAADRDGNLFATAMPGYGYRPIGDRRYFLQARKTKTFAAGEFVIGRNRGLKMFNFACPVLGDTGEVVGVVQVGFSMDRIADIARQVPLPEGATVVIADHAGTVMYLHPDQPTAIGLPDDPPQFSLMQEQEGATSEVFAEQGRHFVAYRKLLLANEPQPYMYLRIRMPETPIIAAGRAVLYRNLSLVLVVTLAAMAAVWWLGHLLIVRPIQELVHASGRLGAGASLGPLPLAGAGGEFGHLARALTETARLLEERERTRQEAERSLRASEERYRRLFDGIADAVLVYELSPEGAPGKFHEVNALACQQLGYARTELLGMTPVQITTPAGVPHLLEMTRQLSASGAVTWESEHRAKDGRSIPVEITHHRFEHAGRNLVLASARDLTQQRKAEQERARLEEQLRQAQRLEAIGRLAGGVAHDFNNLLTGILGIIELDLLDQETTAKARADLLQIKQAATRAADLTRQLLAFSRRQIISPRTLDLNQLVQETRQMLVRLIGEDIDLQSSLTAEPVLIFADPGQVHQVLMNLSANARDAMPRGGRLTIATQRVVLGAADADPGLGLAPGTWGLLVVSDTGCGISRENLAHIFEPFFTTKEVGQGTGLGLATVYGIVQQSGGQIRVESEEGRGTTFRIFFPGANGTVASAPTVAAALPYPGGKETILLVEDESLVRRTLSRFLLRLGYVVIEAEDGEKATTLFAEQRAAIDLLLTDMVMPRLGGAELFTRLRRERPGLKVLFMSGYAENAAAQPDLLRAGGRFIQKPCELADLAQQVRTVLDEPAGA